MSRIASLLGGNAVIVGGAAVVGVVAVVVSGVFKSPEPEVAPTPVVAMPKTEEAPAPEVTEAPATEEAVVEEPTPEAEPEAEVVVETVVPSFDVVRVEPDGNTLIAGHAAAEVSITVLLDGADLAEAPTDSGGKFVTFASIAPSSEPQVLSLVQRREDGDVFSEATVILAPVQPVVAEAEPEPVAEPAEVVVEAVEDAVAEDTVETVDVQPETVEDTEVTAVEETQPAAPTVLLSDGDGVRVLQPPAVIETGPDVTTSLALDTIAYSDAGEVSLTGRGSDEGFVRVYLDNAPITSSRIEAGGNWRTELPDVDTGVYTLRVDQVDAEGEVVSRVETPFKREAPEALQAVAPQGDNKVEAVTVQPGSTLWAIANEHYGDGVLYVRVFEANKDQIVDPNLIFPGQIFSIPEE
ncbi:LysM peptidoglycan-binding domain-containing protein [Shimia sp. CNT1-13L.2]|uniref:LysM peptidoglycan-binding domain-containing protein n=1 Tax=Shimia sp. CNT1-13L.2 TaxID=2959663 RepID=UPI0020CBCC92|nr:LysM peptidoglycan-binding domain-containing protein [Shimia sp. CNT1-13L.2]MCP9483894.1 LysM peptidoglycan-binding domain-containing protein [Shimia sp. CNT1-13L.2]